MTDQETVMKYGDTQTCERRVTIPTDKGRVVGPIKKESSPLA